jgi:ferredoxin
MKRKIIQINENNCNGCGKCVNICAEAAIEIVDGKARLIKDFYCDGMGACLDVCPTDALKIVEKESEEYNIEETFKHVKEKRGMEAAKEIHGIEEIERDKILDNEPMKCGCPGSMMRDMRNDKQLNNTQNSEKSNIQSQLKQWPIQLHLLSPEAPYFQDADLVISADCIPFSFANFHEKFLKGKTLIMFCPKLDTDQKSYIKKLAEIFKRKNIQSISIIRMEVPCCSGVGHITEEALRKAQKNIILKEYTISIKGELI